MLSVWQDPARWDPSRTGRRAWARYLLHTLVYIVVITMTNMISCVSTSSIVIIINSSMITTITIIIIIIIIIIISRAWARDGKVGKTLSDSVNR